MTREILFFYCVCVPDIKKLMLKTPDFKVDVLGLLLELVVFEL